MDELIKRAKEPVVMSANDKLRIWGTGYGPRLEELKIGDTWLQESVVSKWSFLPEGIFHYFSGKTQMALHLCTKIEGNRLSVSALKESEITEEMITVLTEKGRTSFSTKRNGR